MHLLRLFVILCAGKIVVVSAINIVKGPTPTKLVVPFTVVVQYQCDVLVDDIPMDATGTSWMWLVNGEEYTRLSARSNNRINITENSNEIKDETILNVLAHNEKLEIGCQFEIDTGTIRVFNGTTTATLLSFG